MKSWKTTVCGVLAVVVAASNAAMAILDSDPATNPDWAIIAATLMTAIGLFSARDNGKSSEDVGVK